MNIETKEFFFEIENGKPELQCITLLIKVMSNFKDLKKPEYNAIATWFYERYKDEYPRLE